MRSPDGSRQAPLLPRSQRSASSGSRPGRFQAMAEKKNRMVQQPKGFIRFFSALNRGWYKLTGGRIANKFRGAPVVLLTTTGRKTGKARTWPLLTIKQGDAYTFAASFAGHDEHPAWYLNLVANPDVTLRDKN